ncbi:MAG: DegT/DnrJ/EryC1/StrS family aminotransferase [Planctomycetota bacterium]
MSTLTAPADTPAILGGPAAVTLPQDDANRWPIITSEDERAVLDVLRTGELSINPVVTALEDDYRRWLGVKHALAHCNGTSAIHAALQTFGLEPGDEVIVPSATWWASVMPVLHCGAVPVFAETEQAQLGLDPEDVERRITDRTRAMVVVHLFGMPSRMDELMAIARRHGLRVLEDASHAHGATWRDRPIGTLADAAVFSMQSNKLCPSAEGGMLVTDDDEILEKAIRFGHYERLLPMKGSPNRRFAATGFGFKFRMSPLSAAVARTQLCHLEARNRQRNENCIYLSERLEALGFRTFLAPPDARRVYFEFLIGCDESRLGASAPVLARALQAEGALVGAPRYPLLHQQPVFTEGRWAAIARLQGDAARRTYPPDDLPRTVRGNATLMKLPSFPHADRALLDQYAQAFAKVAAHASKLPKDTA